MPTVVLAALDTDGKDLPGVLVFLDDVEVQSALAGRAVALDPGRHQLRFIAPDGREEHLEVVAREWDQGRSLRVHFRPSSAGDVVRDGSAARLPLESLRGAPSSEQSVAGEVEVLGTQRSTLGYALLGVGGAALAGFGYFAWKGRSRESDLRKSCAPRCSEGDADEVRSHYLVADVLLGLGALSLGSGAYLYFSTPRGKPAAGDLAVQIRGSF